ncbi:SDR family NAD(P)-dependent oxidoreductase [Balneolaceae bacterium YR4-1]|uniref:SDR family NAD(P)-dependent oxidoreductase n=1 Tax=Halalkalibaculum roseum TaxID=2709311 RepID=A0A6M1T0K9_9BACT|nr:SDR family NAD(P)-dependent oxidoreductase [Halalkalibaculum roseum]NGP77034.1 SDR family NAD(P)-dependent oxidoreductase [Halalkalibaculum roseum]
MKDKIVLIVGGSGGIGSAAAKVFAKAGAKVVLAARNKSKAEEVAKEINDSGGEAFVIGVDVTDLASVSTMTREVTEDLGSIDVLVNAFGQGIIQPLLDIKPDDAKNVLETNVYGTFLVTQTVVRHMATEKKGRVIMLPGTLGKYVMKNSSVYAASKFAVTGFTKALIEENKRSGIKFTLMHLGGVDTPFWDDDKVDMRVQRDKMLTPEEVGKAIYYAANQPADSVLNEITIQPESHQMV